MLSAQLAAALADYPEFLVSDDSGRGDVIDAAPAARRHGLVRAMVARGF